MYNCSECKERTQARLKGTPNEGDPTIDLEEYDSPLPRNRTYVASWHSHTFGGGSIIQDDQPSGIPYGSNGDFLAGADFWRSSQLLALNGGPGVIAYRGGELIYQHDRRTGSKSFERGNREYRVFPYSWFNQRSGVKQVTVVVRALLGEFYKE